MVVACGHKTTTSTKRGSSGKTLEVLLVADKETYSGDTKNLIDSLFRRPQVGMPQVEPIFDLVNIPVSSFRNTEMFQAHRNVILCDINPDNPNKVYFHTDQHAEPQVVFDCAYPSGLCAERTTVFYANSLHPDTPINILCVCARDSSGDFTSRPCPPCGACRQVLVETEQRFGKPMRVLLFGKEGTYCLDSAADLLPLSFDSDFL